MRNLILLIALVVSMFSNAQTASNTLDLSQTIEITPFTHSNIEYKHVKGSLVEDDNCIDNVTWATSAPSILSLNGNVIIDLNANSRYTIADEPFRNHFISFGSSDDIYFANGDTYDGPDLLECVSVFENPRLDATHDCDSGVQVRGGFVRIPGLARFDVINTSQLVNIPQVHIENTKAFVLSAGPGIPTSFEDPRAAHEAAYTENRPFLYFKRGIVGTHISGVVVRFQGTNIIDRNFEDGDDVFGFFCSTVVPELERLTRVFVSNLDAAVAAASPLNYLPLFEGTEGEWSLSERVAGAGSTTYVWTNSISGKEVTYNTYAGNSQLWSISGTGEDRVASLIAATTQTSHQNALTWASNLIRVSEAGARHRDMVAAQNELKRDIAAIITDRSMRHQVNSDVTSVQLWSVVGHAETRDVAIDIADHDGSVAAVQSAYDAMVTILQNARDNGHLND